MNTIPEIKSNTLASDLINKTLLIIRYNAKNKAKKSTLNLNKINDIAVNKSNNPNKYIIMVFSHFQ